MEQQKWTEVWIGTDIRADHNRYTCKNTFTRDQLEIGGYISQKNLDGSDVFGSVTVVAMDDDSLTVRYGIYEHVLAPGKYVTLASGGRDYASFDLWISIR
ncbi:MAG: hypothetical protein J5545_05745 [Bacteroidaceae bacterium]|nr:hypothetical protein [Bacteroidaceae bacterium]